ncbi:ABC transporter permease [Corynebacterium sp. SCR221107]|uniref:ABC transporter permease n=1 Tax=Corynebacterium sp. SCR221107 TaxID=3017361 RepID=UPI003FA48C7B
MWQFFAVTLADALAGTAPGLLASSFARTQFQAGQFTPALIFPQFLLCGLLVPRDDLPNSIGETLQGVALKLCRGCHHQSQRR